MRKLNNYILCALVSVLLFFAFLASEGMFLIKNSVFSMETYISILEENDIYSKVYSEIEKHFVNEENATAIPADVYLDKVSPELIREITNENLISALEYITGEKENLDFSSSQLKLDEMKKSIDSFFEEYAASINYTKDDAYYAKTESVYRSAVSYITETTDVFQFEKINKAGYLNLARRVYGYTDVLTIATFGAAGFLILLLLLSNLKRIINSLYWISISLCSVSLVILAAGGYFRFSGFFNRFAIKAPHIFSSITGAFYEFTDKLLIMNAILFTAGLVFMILYMIFGKEKNKAK